MLDLSAGCCSYCVFCVQATSVKDIGIVTSEGLIKGHAYAITDTEKVWELGTYTQIQEHISFLKKNISFFFCEIWSGCVVTVF